MKVRILFEEYRQKEVTLELTPEMNIDDLSQQAMHMYDNGEIILPQMIPKRFIYMLKTILKGK